MSSNNGEAKWSHLEEQKRPTGLGLLETKRKRELDLEQRKKEHEFELEAKKQRDEHDLKIKKQQLELELRASKQRQKAIHEQRPRESWADCVIPIALTCSWALYLWFLSSICKKN
ncbi:hypothetical protein B0H67DRAFT_642758 [Lasiosphaeris hirsuta]|uniref:Uncharacterized protein n=1 Tax=Lasiosphaeris hirsuta TaxID=260670 RepID=A0AA40AP24_9PEZI|nr:hypothetical protein B0H67DRAFT_642758 [Lasiosphaeris hirsuta]